jgi:hypothetical protein
MSCDITHHDAAETLVHLFEQVYDGVSTLIRNGSLV